MDHFLDIRLRPDPEISGHHLMAAVFAHLHRVLARTGTSSIAVSFPAYSASSITLGDTLRVIGPHGELVRLSELSWLLSVRDQTMVTGVTPIPENADHRCLRRVQAKSNPERLLRRQMHRHGVTDEEIRSKYDGLRAEHLRLPFLSVTSRSTGQPFKLFLRLGQAEAPREGNFNAFGLSQTATIAWF